MICCFHLRHKVLVWWFWFFFRKLVFHFIHCEVNVHFSYKTNLISQCVRFDLYFPQTFLSFFFFLISTKYLCNLIIRKLVKKEDWKTPRLPQQWYPFWACGSGYSEHKRSYQLTDKVLHGYNIHIIRRTPPARGRSAWPNLRAQGSDGLFGGRRYQTTFTLG